MSSHDLTGSARPATFLTGRERIITALSGIIPASIALPFVLRVWSPSWFVIAWLISYLATSAFFIGLVTFRPNSHAEEGWSITAAALFCAVPISSIVWSTRPEDFWAGATVGLIFIAFEMAALPFLKMREWRIGILGMGATITVCGLLTIHPVVALAVVPIVLTMVSAGTRMRDLKNDLERHLEEAQRTVRHDPLTGLLNRRGLNSRVKELAEQDVTIALIDVDRFKIINDTHGHQVGDQVLVAIGAELAERLGGTFDLARVGGDEFVGIAPGRVSLDSSLAGSKRFTAQIHEQDLPIDCSFSVGVSYGPNVDSAHRLMSEAGFAMREAKRSGATLERFGQDLAERLDRTVEVAAIASGTNESGSFVPVAQTIVANDQIVGCELLIRWQRPDGELLLPGQFLPLAAEAGLMSAINELMLENAVRFAARFNNRLSAPFIAVNVSAPHLAQPGFCGHVQQLLDNHRVPAERLMIEITETDQLAGYSGWEAAALELRALGVKLAMDDFGTGYSSIERLKNLPISHLKFDRSLVQSVSGPFGQIVFGVARFAQAVNIGVIAEGIETLDELESMRAFGISLFQGYHFHRPQSLDDVEIMVIEDQLRAAKLEETRFDS